MRAVLADEVKVGIFAGLEVPSLESGNESTPLLQPALMRRQRFGVLFYS